MNTDQWYGLCPGASEGAPGQDQSSTLPVSDRRHAKDLLRRALCQQDAVLACSERVDGSVATARHWKEYRFAIVSLGVILVEFVGIKFLARPVSLGAPGLRFEAEFPYGVFSLWAVEATSALIRAAVLGGVSWMAVFGRELVGERRAFTNGRWLPPSVLYAAVLLHAACFGIVVACKAKVLYGLGLPISSGAAVASIYGAAVAGLIVTALRLCAPWRFWWRHLLIVHRFWFAAWVTACVSLSLGAGVGISPSDWESVLVNALFPPTAAGASAILSIWGYQPVVHDAAREIFVGNFGVEIGYLCLGYEGMSIALVVLAMYVYAERRTLRFPHVLAIFPAVSAALFVTNCIRVATLVAIGASLSPEVAVKGFHSGAGVINLFAILLLAVFAVSRLPFFSSSPSGFVLDLSDEKVQLVPLLVVMAVALLSLLATADFDWLYPVRVFAGGAVLLAIRSRLALAKPVGVAVPIGVGVIVFGLWLFLEPEVPSRSAAFAGTLFEAPSWAGGLWILLRVTGAVVVVPIAEELAFRGYLLPAAEKNLAKYVNGRVAANALALTSTSVAFGLLHSMWLAGMVAGMAYGLLRQLRGSLTDAVVAHAVTNLLLAGYVVYFGAWSYW